MKVLAINSSARKDGNTAYLIGTVFGLNVWNHIILLIIGVNFILNQSRSNVYLGQECLQFFHIPV